MPLQTIAEIGTDPDFALPKLASLAIVLITNALLQTSFFIIIPSSNDYAKQLGGSSTFVGLVIGIPTAIAGLALLPLMRYDKGGYKLPLRLSCAACVIGHVLYSLAYATNFLYLILIGRIVNGFGFAMWMYCKRYCSDPRIVGIRRRTTLAGFLVAGQAIGMSVGPFFGGLLFRLVGFRNTIFNGFTSPTWIMATIWLAFTVCVELWYEEVPEGQGHLQTPASTLDEGSTQLDEKMNASPLTSSTELDAFHLTIPRIGVMACMCWFAMTCFFILAAWESNIPIFGAATPEFRWSPFAAGNFIAMGGITAFPFLIMNIFLARRVEDRNILVYSTTLGLAALAVFVGLLRANKLTYASMLFCWWAVALGFNAAVMVPVSLLSKQLPPSWNTRISLMIQLSMYTGRTIGAVWGGSGVQVGMPIYIGVEMALVGIGVALYVVFWRALKTKKG